MAASDPITPYLPTIELARSAGLPLPAAEPVQQQRLAMLIVLATLIRRRSWSEDTILHNEMLPGLGRGTPPAPTDFSPRSFVRIEQEIGVETCAACSETPGRRQCRICKGSGVLSNMNMACSCEGGYVACPNCQGDRQGRRVRLRYFTDEPVAIREAYVPSVIAHVPSLFSFESSFERHIDIDQPPPECLRCHDLSDRVGGTAYRGGERRQRPDFRGHDFADTIEKALTGLSALGAGAAVPFYEIRAYAWPILWLHYGAGLDLALFAGRDGLLRMVGGVSAKS